MKSIINRKRGLTSFLNPFVDSPFISIVNPFHFLNWIHELPNSDRHCLDKFGWMDCTPPRQLRSFITQSFCQIGKPEGRVQITKWPSKIVSQRVWAQTHSAESFVHTESKLITTQPWMVLYLSLIGTLQRNVIVLPESGSSRLCVWWCILPPDWTWSTPICLWFVDKLKYKHLLRRQLHT